MGSEAGLSVEQLNHLDAYEESAAFSEPQRAALAAADEMTIGNEGLSDSGFARLRACFPEEAIMELLAVIAWENASSRFNRALRIEAQGLWKRSE